MASYSDAVSRRWVCMCSLCYAITLATAWRNHQWLMKWRRHAHSRRGKWRWEEAHWESEWEAGRKSKSSWVVPSVVFGLAEWLTRTSCKCEVQRARVDRNSKRLLSLATHMRLLSHMRVFDSRSQNAYFTNSVYDCWVSFFLKKYKNDG